VALYGEYELKLQHQQQQYMCNSVLFCDLQRPLTIKDYLENSPTSVIDKAAGAVTDRVAGALTDRVVGAVTDKGVL
jgi:hypothetical protein